MFISDQLHLRMNKSLSGKYYPSICICICEPLKKENFERISKYCNLIRQKFEDYGEAWSFTVKNTINLFL